jgi:hypothetical protein
LSANELLATPPDGDAESAQSWRLKLEGVVREIDASFTADAIPAELGDARARIVTHLKRPTEAAN